MAEVLLISENYIKKYTTVNGSVDPNILYPSVYLAQDKWLLPFLGTDLLNKIKDDVANNTIAGNYQILLEDYIQKMLLWWVMVDYTTLLVDYLCANSSLFPEYSTATWPDRSPRTDVTNTLNYQFSTGNTSTSFRPTYSRNIINRIP
jgi:hypothetical protein